MKVIIPAKHCSSRVTDKNWKPFYKNKSLTEIKIEQLLNSFMPSDIFLSCDAVSKAPVAQKYRINFLHREKWLADDATSWADVLKGIVENTPFSDDEDILWTEVINPLFTDYNSMAMAWGKCKKEGYDSLVLGAPFNKFLLKEDGLPYNFLPGKWHASSQHLEMLYTWEAGCIMQKKDMLYYSYPLGRKPYIFDVAGASIDIDTPYEFELAQQIYTQFVNRDANKI